MGFSSLIQPFLLKRARGAEGRGSGPRLLAMSVAVHPERDLVASDTGSLPSEMGGRGSMKTLGRLLIELAVWGVCSYLLLESTRGLLRALDPMHGEKQAAAKAKERLQKKLRRRKLSQLRLTEHEKMLADEVLDPEEIEGGFDSVGGLDREKREIYELAVLPLKRPDLFNQPGRLLAAPKGLLFYGQPGTGKTMLAKAIAKEAGAAFINVRPSALMNKYFGESNKFVSAMFSLANKLAPAIIFIDEVDSFLKARGGPDETPWLSVKGEFLALWDGITTQSHFPVMVLGATNRPYDLDQAILRRFARQFEIPVPSPSDRKEILSILLRNERVDPHLNVTELVAKTEGYSGSDLKELCRAAVMVPVRELVPYADDGSLSSLNLDDLNVDECRPVGMRDFDAALQRVRPAGHSALEYHERETQGGRRSSRNAVDLTSVMPMLEGLASLAMQSRGAAGHGYHSPDPADDIE